MNAYPTDIRASASTTALVAAGYRPGMKVVPFKSLRRAAWYFTQQYMKYRVGVPIVDVSDEE